MDQKTIIIPCATCGAKNRIPAAKTKQRPVCGKCRSPLHIGEKVNRPVKVTDRDFGQTVLASSTPVLVDCWAPWCGPCRMVAPAMEELATKHAGRLTVAKLNVDENPFTAARYGIQSIPTMLVFKNGKEVDRIIGASPQKSIERRLSPHL